MAIRRGDGEVRARCTNSTARRPGTRRIVALLAEHAGALAGRAASTLLAAGRSTSPRRRCRATWSSWARSRCAPPTAAAGLRRPGGRRAARRAGTSTTTRRQRLARLLGELLVTADGQRQHRRAAHAARARRKFLACALDRAGLPDVLGTIAGDDTISW